MKSFNKIRSRADLMQPCPTCGSSVADIAYVYEDGDERSDFFRCPDCSFLFARPVFIPELDSRQMDGIENAELFNSRLLKSIYINYFIKKCDGDVLKSLTKSRFQLADQGGERFCRCQNLYRLLTYP